MKQLAVFLLITTLGGCSPHSNNHDERLEGKWYSNKELTLKNIDPTKLEEDKLASLKKALGDLGHVFKQGEMAVLFRSYPDHEPEFYTYKITAKTENSVTIISDLGRDATFTFDGDCYFIESDEGVKEYFCKTY